MTKSKVVSCDKFDKLIENKTKQNKNKPKKNNNHNTGLTEA